MRRVLLIRHGETEWHEEKRIKSWSPVPLSEHGLSQAERLGSYLASEYDVGAVYTSDLVRAVETADALGDAVGVSDVRQVPDWRERNFGIYQGITQKRLMNAFSTFHPKFGRRALDSRPLNGESLREASERVLDQWRTLLDQPCSETVAVVTHQSPIQFVVGELRGYDLMKSFKTVTPAHCSVTEIGVDPSSEDQQVIREGATDFLDGENE